MKPYFETPDGRITIYCSRCEDVLPTLVPQSIDLVLTDPPYGSLDVEVGTETTTRLVRRDALGGKRLSSSTGKRWFETVPASELGSILAGCHRLLKPTGALYVFADVKSGLELFPALFPANVLVWDKGKLGMGYNWRRMHEWIAFCPMPEHRLRDQSRGDILRFPGVDDKEHPTEKPVPLLRSIMLNSTDPDALILDPFMGSGSALRAALDTGRRAIGIDRDEEWCDLAARRLSQQVLPLGDIA